MDPAQNNTKLRVSIWKHLLWLASSSEELLKTDVHITLLLLLKRCDNQTRFFKTCKWVNGSKRWPRLLHSARLESTVCLTRSLFKESRVMNTP